MEPFVEFVGWKVQPKEEVSVMEEVDDDVLQTIHTTQVALGEDPAPGPHTVFVSTSSGRFAIGTLEKGRCEHFPVDFTTAGAADSVRFSHSGASDVYITGYKTQSSFFTDDEDDYDQEEEEGDEEAPNAVPINRRKVRSCNHSRMGLDTDGSILFTQRNSVVVLENTSKLMQSGSLLAEHNYWRHFKSAFFAK